MKFSSTEDIAAPIADVFKAYSDFDGFERAALRRGAEIGRTDQMRHAGVGAAWKATFRFRGRSRAATGEIVEFDPPTGYSVDAQAPNIGGMFQVDLMSLSKNRTRVFISCELKPKSLSGRLMLQTLKLTKSRLFQRFKRRASEFAKHVEDDLKGQTSV